MAIKIGLFAKVLVDVPGLPPLDYRIPDDLLVAVGDLVVVPLGSRRVVGVVATLANAADCEDKRLKCISAVLHATAPLNAEWLALTKFAAIYYLRGWGDTSAGETYRKNSGCNAYTGYESGICDRGTNTQCRATCCC